MKIKAITATFITFISVSLLSGCIDTNSPSGSSGTFLAKTKIESFSLSGAGATASGNGYTLKANQPFTLNWTTTHGGMLEINAYLSTSDQLTKDYYGHVQNPAVYTCANWVHSAKCSSSVSNCQYDVNTKIMSCPTSYHDYFNKSFEGVDLLTGKEIGGNRPPVQAEVDYLQAADVYLILKADSATGDVINSSFTTSDQKAVRIFFN